MKYYGMLILAVVLIVPFLIFGITKHLLIEWKKDDDLKFTVYSFNTSYYLDVAACVAIYNELGYTLSATAYHKQDKVMMLLANGLFWDKAHCHKAWLDEFNEKDNT